MRLAIIGDLHFGIKDGSYNSFLYQKHFFEDVLIPNLKNVDGLVFLGDMFHNRRIVNMRILSETIKLFNNLKESMNIPFYCVAGNHDLYFRNTYDTAAVKDILGNTAYYGDEDCYLISDKCLVIHWKNSCEEYEELFKIIKEKHDVSKIEYIFGHFAIVGSKMVGNKVDDNSDDLRKEIFLDYFPNLKKVFSGHFHLPSENRFVKYVGVPYQLTWGEVDNSLGFYILDTDVSTLEFIENPYKIFKYIRVDDNTSVKDILNDSFDFDYKMLYKIIYNGNDFEIPAKEIYNEILNKGHEALLIDENVYKISDVNNDDINNEVKNIGELIEYYFNHTDLIPKGEGAYYYEIFKNFFDDVKKSTENIEL